MGKRRHHQRERENNDEDSSPKGRDSDGNESGMSSGDNDEERRSKTKRNQRSSRSRSRQKSSRHKRETNTEDDDSESTDSSERSYSGDNDDDDSSLDSERRRRRRRRKKSSSSRRKRHKKERKKKSKKKKRWRERSKHDPSENGDNDDGENKEREHNFALADALLALLSKHPGMSEELPILLIRLCSGTTFSLEQSPVQQWLGPVLALLEPHGVYKDATGTYGYKKPTAPREQPHRVDPELVLVKIVQQQLTDIGLSALAVHRHETGDYPANKKPSAATPSPHPLEAKQDPTTIRTANDSAKDIPAFAQRLLTQFPGLEKELVGLCNTILSGESVSVEGLPNEQLKEALTALLEMCQLELCAMEEEEDDDDGSDKDDNDKEESGNDKEAVTMGYCIPDEKDRTQAATTNLNAIVQACTVKAPRVVGPMGPPPDYAARPQGSDNSDDDDDEGPQLTPRLPTLSETEVQSLQKRRQLELERVKAGLDPALVAGAEDGREEWMLVPGKYDFLDSVKSGQPIKNRQFQNLKSGGDQADGNAEDAAAVDPKIQSEMNQLLSAHQEARGPSLMDEHQAAKKQQEEESKSKKKEWQWNREKHLDSGRRVDKNALQMVLGGAADGLKSKFQGGWK